MQQPFEVPALYKDAFHCPICGAYAHMDWTRLCGVHTGDLVPCFAAGCARCGQQSFWIESGEVYARMLYPDETNISPPHPDMPDSVVSEYQEASEVFSRSPRAAAALLRLGLQKLLSELGEDGKNINEDIRSLAEKAVLPQRVVQVADTVRITGNNAVHPGEMRAEDVDYVASKMFDLLNFIVRAAITEPRELEELYERTPEGPRAAAERRDAEARDG